MSRRPGTLFILGFPLGVAALTLVTAGALCVFAHANLARIRALPCVPVSVRAQAP